ncbi:2Fe-2S ferredoxin-like superfamily protein [Striga hermonthica]|uniref:Ferredoxin n=1 Tax=Striga hermonthica TaxID=68872 RepID=A0A9N7NU82_STRHE|nr:2Fe-2S ferredoxin-like superfamily protein [Striga hermonthica]
MAALHFTLPLNFNGHKTPIQTQFQSNHLKPQSPPTTIRRRLTAVRAYKVVVEHDGGSTELEVEPDETILSKALDAGLDVPHDCKLGVCMTCPAQLVSGKVDQSEGMLSDDVIESGYALMCASYPRSDCRVKVIPEEELLSLQLATAND